MEKINFKHSLIFFNFCILISPFYFMVNYEPIIFCLILILILGISHGALDNLKGKNAEYNAEKIVEIYKGKSNEFSQSVALNVAAGLIVSGSENNFKTAFDKASKHLASGSVFQHLSKLQSI